MSEEIKIGNASSVTPNCDNRETSPFARSDDTLAESADSESVQLRAARKIMREYSETLKMLADS